MNRDVCINTKYNSTETLLACFVHVFIREDSVRRGLELKHAARSLRRCSPHKTKITHCSSYIQLVCMCVCEIGRVNKLCWGLSDKSIVCGGVYGVRNTENVQHLCVSQSTLHLHSSVLFISFTTFYSNLFPILCLLFILLPIFSLPSSSLLLFFFLSFMARQHSVQYRFKPRASANIHMKH